jgi:hypothetical protein
MDVLFYIIGGLAVVIGGWWAVKVALGMGLPLEKTAFAYFTQLLKKMELSQVVPSTCVAECVAESIKFARSSARMLGQGEQHARSEVIKQLELHADMLRFWVRGNDPFNATYKSHFKEMFERHQVPRLAGKP